MGRSFNIWFVKIPTKRKKETDSKPPTIQPFYQDSTDKSVYHLKQAVNIGVNRPEISRK